MLRGRDTSPPVFYPTKTPIYRLFYGILAISEDFLHLFYNFKTHLFYKQLKVKENENYKDY